jgi:NADH-quinone oxidoreductase subunit K
MIPAVGLEHYLMLSAFIFSTGVLVMITKRNAVGILIGVELLLNAANVNLIAFSRYQVGDLNGQLTALFVIVLAAAEAAVAIAIFVNIYNNFATIDVDRADLMKG